MFRHKNISPRNSPLLLHLYWLFLSSLLVYFIEKRSGHGLWFLLYSFGGYLLISFILERFIYRKIKLIYKFIYQTKATKKEETYYKYVLTQKKH